MPLQDLTPQLRTRLNRMEKTVGWFVFLATILMVVGFGYYIYQTAASKGWFVIKAPFYTYVNSSDGLNVGDPVVMMGFKVGEITDIHPMPPGDRHNVRVKFEVKDNYFRYIWLGGSYIKINSGMLAGRQLEITRGTNGPAICVTQPVLVFSNLTELRAKVAAEPDQWQLSQEVFDSQSNRLYQAYEFLTESNLNIIAALKPDCIYAYNNREKDEHRVVASWNFHRHRYENFHEGSEDAKLYALEATPIGDQVSAMVNQVQAALPGILLLTNKIAAVLDNAVLVTSNLNVTLVTANNTLAAAQPLVTNVAYITGELKDPGSPVLWALGTNGNAQIQGALANVNSLLANTDTNLAALLINLADITGSLRAQIGDNTNLITGINKTIVDTDDMIQGLKRHWLLRSAFKTNQPPAGKK